MSTKASPNTGDMAPLPFTFSPLIQAGEAIELPPEEGWQQWDAVVRLRDAQQGAKQ